MHGGSGFSQVPDRCEIALDLRLTPAFDAAAARRSIGASIARHDAAHAGAPPTQIEWIDGWPAYRVADAHPMVAAMRDAAHAVLGRELPTAVVGPSNIGNYLASIGIPALCGFGVAGRNLHAADEAIELASIEPVYRIYEQALLRLLAA
jgi:succinyl-diaminopimelate desuccinylase